MRSLFFIFCSMGLVSFNSIFSETALRINEHRNYELDTYLSYYIDYEGLNDSQFFEKDNKNEILWNAVPYRGFSFGRVENPVWMKLRIKNERDASSYILTSYFPLADQVAMIIPQKNIRLVNGMKVPLKDRDIQDIQFHFPVEFQKGESVTIYVRADTCCSFYSTTDLYMESYLPFVIIKNNLSLLVYLCFAFVAVLQSLFYFYYGRDKIYLYFILSIVFISSFHLSMFGYMYAYFVSDYDINVFLLHFTGELAGYFNLIFVVRLFNLDIEAPRLAKYYRFFGMFLFGGMVLYFAGLENHVRYFNSFTLAAAMVSYLFLAASFLRVNRRMSVLFLIFWSVHIGGVLFYSLSNLGIVPLNRWNVDVTLYGHATETIGIAYLLISRGRMNVLEKIETELKSKKSGSSLPALLDINRIKENLISLIENEKLHLDWDANSELFAQRLGISYNQFSAFMNNHLNTTFRDFLNLYRVKEAQQLLESRADDSIISIMHRSGFNSKSTFNRVFLETVGTTPGAYKKHAEKNKINA